MISAIRIEGYGDSPYEIQREIDAMLVHLQVIGILEGCVPAESHVADEVYPRQTEPVRIDGSTYSFQFSGRKVLHFVPNEGYEMQRPAVQDDKNDWYLFDPPSAASHPSGSLTTASSAGVRTVRVMTDRFVVVQRQLPLDWPDPVYADDPNFLSEPPRERLTPEAMARFTELATHPVVTGVAFGPSKSRPGWEIDISCSATFGDSAMMMSDTIYGETFPDAVEAAHAAVAKFGP